MKTQIQSFTAFNLYGGRISAVETKFMCPGKKEAIGEDDRTWICADSMQITKQKIFDLSYRILHNSI